MVTMCPRTDKVYQFAKSISDQYRLNDSELYRWVFLADIFQELGMYEKVLISDFDCGGDGNAIVLPQAHAKSHPASDGFPEGHWSVIRPHPTGPSTVTIHDARKVKLVNLPDELRDVNFYKEERERIDQLTGANG